jgi:hypothetical protein
MLCLNYGIVGSDAGKGITTVDTTANGRRKQQITREEKSGKNWMEVSRAPGWYISECMGALFYVMFLPLSYWEL